jgi:hypothetical protein
MAPSCHKLRPRFFRWSSVCWRPPLEHWSRSGPSFWTNGGNLGSRGWLFIGGIKLGARWNVKLQQEDAEGCQTMINNAKTRCWYVLMTVFLTFLRSFDILLCSDSMMGDDGSYVNHFLELERTSMIFKSMSNGMFLVLRDTFRYPPLDQTRWFASLCFPLFSCSNRRFSVAKMIAIWDFKTLSICCGREHIFPSRRGEVQLPGLAELHPGAVPVGALGWRGLASAIWHSECHSKKL